MPKVLVNMSKTDTYNPKVIVDGKEETIHVFPRARVPLGFTYELPEGFESRYPNLRVLDIHD